MNCLLFLRLNGSVNGLKPRIYYITLNSVATHEILKLLKNIAAKKAAGTDKIPPKLVKLPATVLSQPLADAINNSISKAVFPDNAKVAFFSPVD